MTTTATTAVATKPQTPIDTVRVALDRMKSQFAMALPKHITADRLCRVAITAIQQNPKLLDCERTSLYSAIMRSAQLGLEPDGILGQAYLIPFKKNFKDGNQWKSKMEVQFIPGYKGLIDLARRSGEVSNIIAKEVCRNDEFTVDFSREVPFTHKPKLDGDRGDVTHFWAMARFKDGGFHWDYMTRAEVEAIRDKGNGKDNKVWVDHFIEMGKKTAIRRIAKYLPMSVQKAAIVDELQEAGKPVSITDYGDVVIDNTSGEIIDNTPQDEVKTQSKLDEFGGKTTQSNTPTPTVAVTTAPVAPAATEAPRKSMFRGTKPPEPAAQEEVAKQNAQAATAGNDDFGFGD